MADTDLTAARQFITGLFKPFNEDKETTTTEPAVPADAPEREGDTRTDYDNPMRDFVHDLFTYRED